MFRNMLMGAGATALVVATATEISLPPRPKILYNPSASAPIGYYSIGSKETLTVGDQVALYAPDWARELADERGYLPYDYPLIKTIIGSEGDRFCGADGFVSGPNGTAITRLLRDRLDCELPSWQDCLVLSPDEYFVVSPETEAGISYGFDSRYFGPVSKDMILGRVEFLGNPVHKPSGKYSENRGK